MRTLIFYGKSAVIITNEALKSENEKTIVLKEIEKSDYFDTIDKLKAGECEHIIIQTEDIDSILQKIQSYYHVIEAAGGLITNQNNETLMIYRRGKWDLPKGKIEKDEPIEIAAEREIEEETGVKNLKLLNKLKNTYHTYNEKGVEVFKITHWFHFSIDDNPVLIPQIEEEIIDIKWFSNDDLSAPLSNTYESIKDLLMS